MENKINVLEMHKVYENKVHKSSRLGVIISHSDLDGVTSALNLAVGMDMARNDVIVFQERTSRKEVTTEIVKEFIAADLGADYEVVEFMISDRMFIELDGTKYPEKYVFSWYDHHEGNKVSKEEIWAAGISTLDYDVYTDMHHSGATITQKAMKRRIPLHLHDEYDHKLKNFSYNVNLWDTFRWKNDPTCTEEEKYIGQVFGTIDKMVANDKELFNTLLEFVKNGSLDDQAVGDWYTGLYNSYQELVNEAYEKAIKEARTEIYNNNGKAFIIALLPAEWKYASMVKEKAAQNNPRVDCFITYHQTGGTVYTANHVEDIPSYDIAKYIGETFGLNGGGHKHAAGFGCFDKAISETLEESIARNIVKNRILTALQEFFTLRNRV